MCETSNYGSPSCADPDHSTDPDHCADPDHFADTGYPDPVPQRQKVSVLTVPVPAPVPHTEGISIKSPQQSITHCSTCTSWSKKTCN
jgi:hypothetical protein